jgi:pseudouridine synthase
MPEVRLNKLLSQSGVASRRLADELIAQGRVWVNGKAVTALGTRADPERDDVRVDGRRLKLAIERRYLLLYKPRGVMSTRSDPQRRRTVLDLLAKTGISGYFYPVGRLDYDSEGLILLTNDGDFAEHVTHPRYEMERTYEALVLGVPDDRDVERLRRGVVIDGHRTQPAKVRVLRLIDAGSERQAVLELTLREGRNRQVRDMCDAIGHPVDRLRRTRIGAIDDRGMRPGQVRDLTAGEVRSLMGDQSARAAGPAARDREPASRPAPSRSHAPRPRTPVRTADRRPSGRPGRAAAPRGRRPPPRGRR